MAALPPWTNQALKLYHGTLERHILSIQEAGIHPFKGKMRTDFGVGFYTTTRKRQAIDWACQVADKQGGKPAVLGITVNRFALSRLLHLDFRKGDQQDTDFWSFVTHCRQYPGRKPVTGDYYGVVYGPVSRRVDRMLLWPGLDQISFHGDFGRDFLNDQECATFRALTIPDKMPI